MDHSMKTGLKNPPTTTTLLVKHAQLSWTVTCSWVHLGRVGSLSSRVSLFLGCRRVFQNAESR